MEKNNNHESFISMGSDIMIGGPYTKNGYKTTTPERQEKTDDIPAGDWQGVSAYSCIGPVTLEGSSPEVRPDFFHSYLSGAEAEVTRNV